LRPLRILCDTARVSVVSRYFFLIRIKCSFTYFQINFSLKMSIKIDKNSDSGIDRADLKILRALQRDGRISNLALAQAVGLSPTAVLARTQRLLREGYVLGFEARLNPLKLELGMAVFVEVLLDRTTPNVFDAFKAAVEVHDEIMECHLVAGGFDYLLKLRVTDMSAYRNFAGRVLWLLPGVRETRTYAVMEVVKESMRIAI
jgi:Lrp/AsnC family transcriptional regulator, leucine-responsive regulatory protein